MKMVVKNVQVCSYLTSHMCQPVVVLSVDECTPDNEGATKDVNSSCSVCICKVCVSNLAYFRIYFFIIIGIIQSGEWTCKKKEVNCPKPLCNPDQVITIGCCPVCVGTSRDPRAKVVVSILHKAVYSSDSTS